MITFRVGMHMHLFGSLAHIVLILCWCPAHIACMYVHAALAIYTRSPTVSTVKSFTSFNLEKPGYSEERLAHAQQMYIKIIEKESQP